MLDDLRFRLRALFRRRIVEQELDDELQFHVEQSIRVLMASGVPKAEAIRRARAAFGGADTIREGCRDARGVAVVETTVQDVRYAIRMLRRNPGFSGVLILTLALGIGATSTIFSVVNAILLAPLPRANSERVVVIRTTVQRDSIETRATSYPDFRDWRAQSRSFDAMAAVLRGPIKLTTSEGAVQVRGALVSATYFAVLGIEATHGRLFVPGEDEIPDVHSVALLGHRLWQRRFGGQENIVGTEIRLNDRAHTVVGILPQGFDDLDGDTEVWLPTMMATAAGAGGVMEERGTRTFGVLARLKEGVSVENAQVDLNTVARNLARQYPRSNANTGAIITPLRESLVADLKLSLLVLMGAVGFVLLAAAANVTNLILVRDAARQREFAVRRTLGAHGGRLARQLLTESLLLAVLGGIGGLALAFLGVRVLLVAMPLQLPSFVEVAVDGTVVFFTCVVAAITGLGMGLLPSLASVRRGVDPLLRAGSRYGAASVRSGTRSGLVVAEVALALLLLVGAGLMIQSFVEMRAIDPGFEAEGLATARVGLLEQDYPNKALWPMAQRLRDRLVAGSGVRDATVSGPVPLAGGYSATILIVEGRDFGNDTYSGGLRVYRHHVDPYFFSTLRIPLERGRGFSTFDTATAPPVAIISAALARRVWGEQDPLGHRLRFRDDDAEWITIIGVVGNVRHRNLVEDPFETPDDPDVYFPLAQRPVRNLYAVVRTETNGPVIDALQGAVHDIDPNVPVWDATTLQSLLERRTAGPHFVAWLMGLFAVVALGLAVVGIYGVVSYTVRTQTHSIGVRVALGARRSDVVRMVVQQSMRMILAGLVIGLSAAAALTRVMESLLYEVEPTDPPTFLAVTAVLAATALVACCGPALRAARLNPITALRCE